MQTGYHLKKETDIDGPFDALIFGSGDAQDGPGGVRPTTSQKYLIELLLEIGSGTGMHFLFLFGVSGLVNSSSFSS